MSTAVREIIEQSAVSGFRDKAVLLHIADTVRAPTWTYWRSKKAAAARLGTDRKTIARAMASLEKQGLILRDGERRIEGSLVDVYRIDLGAVLALPAAVKDDTRAAILSSMGGTESPTPEVLRAPHRGTHNTPNHNNHDLSVISAQKNRETPGTLSELRDRRAREVDPDDHLANDPQFAAWAAEQASAARSGDPIPFPNKRRPA